MTKELLYMKGYLAGYWDGVKDFTAGKVIDWHESDLGKLPIQAMGLSTRAHNCLVRSGCIHVADVIALSNETIMRIRNLGPKTASEIAGWLVERGVLYSAWSEYLKV